MVAPTSIVNQLYHKQVLNDQDVQFANFLLRLDPNITSNQLIIFLALNYYSKESHVAMDQDMLDDFVNNYSIKAKIIIEDEINTSKLVGEPGKFVPFTMIEGLLYNHKNAKNEIELANWIIERTSQEVDLKEEERTKIDSEIFSSNTDPQATAVYQSFKRSLLFITGGPGTGKTFTVNKIIEAHRKVFGDSYSIQIAAPTGKAAQRLNNSLSDKESSIIAVTLHKLLGATNFISNFKYHRKNPITIDLLVVDETSMMDLSLWHAMINAVSEKTKIIIVGDPFQIASVESGSVLGDICSVLDTDDSRFAALSESIIKLKKRHRFSSESGINLLADSINSMDVNNAIDILESEKYKDVDLINLTADSLNQVLVKYAIEPHFNSKDNSFGDYQIISVLRNGKLGCITLNNYVEIELKKLIGVPISTEWFDKRVVMANKNINQIGVQNGEMGTYKLATGEILFTDENVVKKDILNHYEPGYCITIHKSQGSEFNHVAIILSDQLNPLLTKELLYTAVTRARKSVLVVGSKQILNYCISNKTKRKTGLVKQLEILLG